MHQHPTLKKQQLQWERKWLMHQLKYEFSEEDREELFLTWNIHRESKERKGQLLRKVGGALCGGHHVCVCVCMCTQARVLHAARAGVAEHANAGPRDDAEQQRAGDAPQR